MHDRRRNSAIGVPCVRSYVVDERSGTALYKAVLIRTSSSRLLVSPIGSPPLRSAGLVLYDAWAVPRYARW